MIDPVVTPKPPVIDTWLFYSVMVLKSDTEIITGTGSFLGQLQGVGVSLLPLEDGSIAATGPSTYFTWDTRRELRRRVRALHFLLVHQRQQRADAAAEKAAAS